MQMLRQSHSRTKRALVVGNDDYKEKKLSSCVNDAEDISKSLKEIGFQVTTGVNQNHVQMTNLIGQFVRQIRNEDLVLFYYSGHGMHKDGQLYLIPTDYPWNMHAAKFLEHYALSATQTLQTMMTQKARATIFLLDCCRKSVDSGTESTRTQRENMFRRQGPIDPWSTKTPAKSFVVFACPAGGEAWDSSPNRRNGLFAYHVLQHIREPDLDVQKMFTRVADGVMKDADGRVHVIRLDSLTTSEICLNSRKPDPSKRSSIIRWQKHAITVAGGHGPGEQTNQLDRPSGLFVTDDGTVYIDDGENHRILAWKADHKTAEIVAGGNGQGDALNQLDNPTDVIFDPQNESLLIADRGNRRVMRWFLHQRRGYGNMTPKGEIVINQICCFGLAIDGHACLYVSDWHKNEVKRFKPGEDAVGTSVAGGNGPGKGLHQLHFPTYIFVDEKRALYVSDHNNHRVMKWTREGNPSTVVAGGNGQGTSLKHLWYPNGVWVDKFENVYVADQANHRVVRWEKGAKEGTLLVGGVGEGTDQNQLSCPEDIFVDRHDHLYVVDADNHRIQRFSCHQ